MSNVVKAVFHYLLTSPKRCARNDPLKWIVLLSYVQFWTRINMANVCGYRCDKWLLHPGSSLSYTRRYGTTCVDIIILL